MGHARGQEASSSSISSPSPCIYDAFLSFRGGDTRKGFTDHLYAALKNAGLRIFRDDDELPRTEDIKRGFPKAIQQSRSSVIVFSKNYASSDWCLDEIVMISERMKMSDHVVLPIFYNVYPSEVRNQTGSYASAFATHEKTQSLDKVNRWRAALAEVADLAGMVLQNEADGFESKFIQKIVKEIEDKVRRMPFHVGPYLVGIHSRAEKINFWLQDRSNDVGIMVIHGMRGIGKTTIAQYVYNSNYTRFEGASFLENVREISEQHNGLVQLQMQLLQDVSRGGIEVKIRSVNEGLVKIGDAMSSKRLLLVLDDVDHMNQLEALLMRDRLHPGSKVIITTTHAGLLKADHYRVTKMHNLETLDLKDSLELFSCYAFGQHLPNEAYMELSERVVQHCQRLPLALKILGSSLERRSIEVWESALEKLKAIPDSDILKKLKISYDSLQDDDDKNIFLDIACFFIGEDKDVIVKTLDACGFYPVVGIQNLIDRCLIEIDACNKVQMHHMIRDMGREIARKESNRPEKRRRLWHDKDSIKVLTEKNGTETIEGLALNLPTHQTDGASSCDSSARVVEMTAFSRLRNLRLLKVRGVEPNGSFNQLPNSLRYLHWDRYPLTSIPSDLCVDGLAVLQLLNSSLRKIWEEPQFPSLKIMDLSHSHYLETCDFSIVPNLEKVTLKDCASLVYVHESIGELKRLVYLNMSGCTKLKYLPMLPISIETFIVSGCSNLIELPRMLRELECLKVFEADNVPLDHQLISSIISSLRLPSSLTHLCLRNCNLTADHFPVSFGSLSTLHTLFLDRNPICILPDFIKDLTGLHKLSFVDCTSLASLVHLPKVEDTLDIMGCTSLEKITFQSIDCMPSCYQYSDCSISKLVEIGYYYRLEPIRMASVEMLNLLGLCNLDSMDPITMRRQPQMFWNMNAREMQPIQGLYEFGIFSTFFFGE